MCQRSHGYEIYAGGGDSLYIFQSHAATGVDFISVGALTHSPRAIDLSLEMTHGTP
jgi:nicotinate-nucleotide pyrophosphorylase (carboxylating)